MKKYSVAMFGSSLREDFDKYSDRDLLIVAENYLNLKKLNDIYSKDNWSISCYTYSKLNFLSKNGSLFIKHLINESNIIMDDGNHLSEILNNYSPKKNYLNDVSASIKYFNILKLIPNTILGYSWFCDCFYVGLRNYLIFKNAQNNIFEFSFNRLLKTLVSENTITNQDLEILKELRVTKRNYREDILDELPSKEFVLKIIKIGKKLNLLDKCEIVQDFQFKENVEQIIENKNFEPYQKLRLIEGYYCSQENNVPEIKKIISNPQFYASKLKDSNYTLMLISEIKNSTQRGFCTNETSERAKVIVPSSSKST